MPRCAWIAALCLLLAAGCATPLYPWRAGRLEKQLQESAERYADNLRWGRIDFAVKQVQPELRPAFLALFDDEKSPLRLTDIQVSSVETGPEPEQGRVQVRVTLYHSRALTERSMTELQEWRFDRKRAAWLVEPDLALYERACTP
jgi:hypothetical protein